jgi:hypothetical protein
MPRRGRPTPWDITFLDDGLSRMELAVGWRQLAPPPFCYCISSPKSKFAPSAFVKQTQRLTATDGLAAGVLRRPCPNVAHVAKTEVPDFRLLSPNLLIPSDWSCLRVRSTNEPGLRARGPQRALTGHARFERVYCPFVFFPSSRRGRLLVGGNSD